MNNWNYDDLGEDFVEERDKNLSNYKSVVYFEGDTTHILALVYIDGKPKRAIIDRKYIENTLHDI